jgi:DNA-binding XRE family transcriptional regulator
MLQKGRGCVTRRVPARAVGCIGMAPDPDPPVSLRADSLELQAVGRTIRQLRKKSGLSMAALAERAGLSQPFISQLESGAHTPSLMTLYRVSAALEVLPGELFGGTPPMTGWVRHEPCRISASDLPHAPVATVLVPGAAGGILEAYEWLVSPDEQDQQWWQHEGEDLVYVISGVIVVEVQGSAAVSTISAGESAHLVETHRPHRWRLEGDEPARILLVVGNSTSGLSRPSA